MQNVSISMEVSSCIEIYFKFDDICITLVCLRMFRLSKAAAMSFLEINDFLILAWFVCQRHWQYKCFCEGWKEDCSRISSLLSGWSLLEVCPDITDLPSYILSSLEMVLLLDNATSLPGAT